MGETMWYSFAVSGHGFYGYTDSYAGDGFSDYHNGVGCWNYWGHSDGDGGC